jgi:heme exporter protein A
MGELIVVLRRSISRLCNNQIIAFGTDDAFPMKLVADTLACTRGGREVFAGLSFSVAAGEALLVTGRNGAGKSSLLRAIAGLVRLTAGTLALDPDRETSLAEQVHYLGHHDAVKSALSVGENLRFWTAYLGGSGNTGDALTAVGLDAIGHLPAGTLSAGQKRRLSIARLLSVKRPVWLLDEPTASLDAPAQSALAGIMDRHLHGGGIVIAATHADIGLKSARSLRLGPA